MKLFNRWLNAERSLLGVFQDAARTGILDWYAEGGRDGQAITEKCRALLSPDRYVGLCRWVMKLAMHPEQVEQAWVMCDLLTSGVKVFCPSARECEALGSVEIGIPWRDYRQPFDSFAVVFPDGFSLDALPPGTGRPVAVVSRFDHARRAYASVLLTEERSIVSQLFRRAYYHRNHMEDEEIERSFAAFRPKDAEAAADDTRVQWALPSAHYKCADESRRIAMNAGLLLTHYGARALRSANPEHEARLRRTLAKSVPDAVRAAAERELSLIPVVYGFDQTIRIYDEEPGAAEGAGTGRHVKPHWRRGHWARLACGAGHADRRLSFRRPALVNREYLAGPLSNTRVTMVTGGAR